MATLLLVPVELLWLTTVGMMIVKTPRSTITLYRLQALAEAGFAAVLAVTGHIAMLWISVFLVVIIKVILIPHLTTRYFKVPDQDYGAKGPLGMGALLMLALLLTIGGFLLGRMGLPVAHSTLIGFVMASLFVSFLHTSFRYELWSVLWAVLSLDTIVGVGALAFAAHLPESADLGINVISLALAWVLAYVAGQIQRIKQSSDIRNLEELIG